MIYDTLRLMPTVNADGKQPVAEVLKGIDGVRGIALSPVSKALEISFDANLTSIQELTMVLTRAGYSVQASASSQHRSGNCCGGCGG